MGVIFGYILSAVLDKAFSRMFDNFWDRLFSGDNLMTNWIYHRVAEGVTVNLSFYLFIAFGMLVIVLYYNKNYKKECYAPNGCDQKCGNCNENIFIAIKAVIERRMNKKYKNDIKVAKVKCGIFLLLICAILVGFLTLTNYISHTTVKLQNNIMIASAYIDEDEYNLLRAEFYMMKSRSDYNFLCQKLKYIEDNNGIEMQR